MELSLGNITIMLNIIAVALMSFVLCYSLLFQRGNKVNIISLQAFLFLIASLSEMAIAVCNQMEIGLTCVKNILGFLYNMCYCYSYVVVVRILWENSKFCKQFKKKTANMIGILLMFVMLIFCWLIMGCPSLVSSGKADFSAINSFLSSAETRMGIMLLIYCIVMLVLAKKNGDGLEFHICLASIVMVAVSVAIWYVEIYLIPEAYASSAIDYAIAGSLFIMFMVTSRMKETVEREAAVSADMEMAKFIQADVLPQNTPAFPSHREIDLTAYMNTYMEVGGDLYNYFEMDHDHVGFLIGDVPGNGISAALYMTTLQNTITAIAENSVDTEEILTRANEIAAENNDACMYAAFWIGVLDLRTHRLQFTNAGSNIPYLIHADGSYEKIEQKHGHVIGILENKRYGSTSMELKKGDRICLYTDGVINAVDMDEKLYGEDRLLEVLLDSRKKSCADAIQAIKEDMDSFCGSVPQMDDSIILMVDFNFENQAEESDFSFDFLDEL